MEKRLIAASEAAAQLGVAKSTIYLLCRQRKIPHIRIGDRLLFDLDEIIAATHVPAENGHGFAILKKSSAGADR